jgi:hypothetical protein
MSAIPSWLELPWGRFAGLLPPCPTYDPSRSLGWYAAPRESER